MTGRLSRLGLVGLALAAVSGAGALWWAVRLPLAAPRADSAPTVAASIPAAPAPPGSPASLDSSVVARDLFRADRSPAPVAFDPLGGRPDAPPPEPVPLLTVAGLVLGAVRAALIRGIPGSDAPQVLAEGEELGGVRLLKIGDTGITLLWRGDTLRVALPQEGS